MGNYFNIIPIILLDAFIILLFEGILFFTYLLQIQEKIVKEQLQNYIEKLIEVIDKNKNLIINIDNIKLNLIKIYNTNNTNNKVELINDKLTESPLINDKILNSSLLRYMEELINELEKNEKINSKITDSQKKLNLFKLLLKTMQKEELTLENNKKKGLLLLILILTFIIIILLVYILIVKYYFNANIEWSKIFIIVFITIILIMIMEGLYVVYILFNKKFNNNRFKLDLLKTLE